MPSRVADPSAGTLAREAARRRAVDVLHLASAIAQYGSEQINNGLGPEQARRTVIEVAADLEQIAVRLRSLARLTPADRRALAVEMTADGLSQREVARTLGVSRRRAWDYLHDRS